MPAASAVTSVPIQMGMATEASIASRTLEQFMVPIILRVSSHS